MTKEETQNKYNITIRGTDQNTNPTIRLQKAQGVLMDSYEAYKLGLCDAGNVVNARKRAMQEMNISDWEELVMPTQPPPPPPPPPDDIKIKAEDLTDGEKAQVLQKRGIQPDIAGRKMNEDNRRDELEFDQLSKVADTFGKSAAKNADR